MEWYPDNELRQDGQDPPEDPDEPATWEPDDPDESLEMGRRVTLVAVFRDVRKAEACRKALKATGVNAAVTLFSSRATSGGNPSDGGQEGLGTGLTVGASIGATAGMLAATYVFPGLGGPLISASPTVTTLAGAGIGSFLGSLADVRSGESAKAAVLAIQVRNEDVQRAQEVVNAFRPDQVRKVTS